MLRNAVTPPAGPERIELNPLNLSGVVKLPSDCINNNSVFSNLDLSEEFFNLNIEELPQEARHKLCKKIMRKNSRLIDSF